MEVKNSIKNEMKKEKEELIYKINCILSALPLKEQKRILGYLLGLYS